MSLPGVILLGSSLLARHVSPLRVAAGSLAASIAFFVVSNLAVWAVWHMYPKTLAGLMTAYVAAIPFFRNQVLADLVFSAALFGIGAAVERRASKAAPGRIRAV